MQQPLSFGFTEALTGGHMARSMMYLEMEQLIQSLPVAASKEQISEAVVEANILGKPTRSSRVKSLRHLVELYELDTTKALFRILWDFGHRDFASLPLLCLVCVYARDPQLRHSFDLVKNLRPGQELARVMMEEHLEKKFPGRFNPVMKKSLAQNVNTSWTFAGHLTGKARKIRQLPSPTLYSAAYAMLVGYLTGLRGTMLLESDYALLVSANRAELQMALSLASARGIISVKQVADVVEFDFSALLSPSEQELLYGTH